MYFKNYATRKVERISQDVELKEKHIDYKCNTLYRNPSIIHSILKTKKYKVKHEGNIHFSL